MAKSDESFSPDLYLYQTWKEILFLEFRDPRFSKFSGSLYSGGGFPKLMEFNFAFRSVARGISMIKEEGGSVVDMLAVGKRDGFA